MRRLFVPVILLCCLAASLFALRWPLPEAALRSSFAVWQDGAVSRGMHYDHQEANVVAVADGELLFYAEGSSLPGNLPVPGGSFVALVHPKDLMSVYTGLDLALGEVLDGPVYEGDILGRGSGRIDRPTAFYLFDRKAGVFVNPLVVLPQIPDTRPPQFRSLVLDGNGQQLPVERARSISQGHYHLLLDVSDPLVLNVRALPYSIRLSINGVERQRLVLDSAHAEKGSLSFSSLLNKNPPAGFTAAGQLNLGSFLFDGGSSVISLVLHDFNNNRLERSWTVSVP